MEGSQYTAPFGPKCFGCQGFEHMKQECPTYLKSIGKSKALAATLSAFTNTMDPTEGIVEAVDEEKDLVESKFEKMDDQDDIHTAYAKLFKVSEKHEKLYRFATKKLSDVELDWEELSTKVDEANQVIGVLRFENNFLVERIKKLEAELFQVRAQLESTSSAKLNKMLSIQKAAFDKTSLGNEFSSPNIASSSITIFVSPTDNVNFENNESKIEIASENLD